MVIAYILLKKYPIATFRQPFTAECRHSFTQIDQHHPIIICYNDISLPQVMMVDFAVKLCDWAIPYSSTAVVGQLFSH
jgi:hypothetical protein